MRVRSRVRCAPRAVWIQKMWEGPVCPDNERWPGQSGRKGPSHIGRELLRRLFFRQLLLPIDNELPRSDRVRLPDLKKMTGLEVPVAGERVLSVTVGEITRGTHVTSQLLERHLAGLRAQQDAGGILAHRREAAFAVNTDFLRGYGQGCLSRVDFCRLHEFLVHLRQRHRLAVALRVLRAVARDEGSESLGLAGWLRGLNSAIENHLPRAILLFLPNGNKLAIPDEFLVLLVRPPLGRSRGVPEVGAARDRGKSRLPDEVEAGFGALGPRLLTVHGSRAKHDRVVGHAFEERRARTFPLAGLSELLFRFDHGADRFG